MPIGVNPRYGFFMLLYIIRLFKLIILLVNL